MIVVAGRVSILAEKRDQAREAAIKCTRATQSDRGCIQYHFYADLEDSLMFHVFEEWESEEALKEHLKQPHTVEFLSALASLAAGEPQVKRYVVATSGNLF